MSRVAHTLTALLALVPSFVMAQLPTAAPAPQANDPIVLDLLAINPTTPENISQVIDTLIALGHPAAAAPLLDKLNGLGLDADGLVALESKVGSGFLLKLSLEPALQPLGKQFVDSVFNAIENRARDPERLAGQLDRLGSANRAEALAAAVALQGAREAGAAALLGLLADPQREAVHARAIDALAAMGEDAVGPVLAALGSDDNALRRNVVVAAAKLKPLDARLAAYAAAFDPAMPAEVRAAARDALSRSAAPVDASSAAAALYDEARMELAGQRAWLAGADGLTRVWRWNAESGRPQSLRVPPRLAATELAVRWAGAARRIVDRDLATQRLELNATAELIVGRAISGVAQPAETAAAMQQLAAAGDAALADALATALAENRSPAAAMLAQTLGLYGTSKLLAGSGNRPSPLVRAVNSRDQRVRFAALEAVLRLEPQEPFAGSSDVLAALEFCAASTGARRALAVHTSETEAARLAGLLAALGYEADIATCADMALERLIASPDYELAVIDLVAAEPTSGEIISRIRRDSRCGAIPVLVVADREMLPRAETVARQHRLTSAYVRPIHIEAMRYGLEHLGREAADAAPTPSAERLAHAKASIDWINAILAQPRHVLPVGALEPVLSRAAWRPALAAGAVQALAQIGVPGAQRTLVRLASRDGADVAHRRAAAEAFARNVERFGTLLSAGEILLQYDRYNASAQQPAEVQAVLALVLDAMEARAGIAPRDGAGPPAS